MAAAGCAGGEPSVSNVGAADECSSDAECDAGMCVEGRCVLTEDEPDAAEPEPEPDVPEPDVELDEGPTVEIGDPCDEDDDCPSGWCIEVAGGNGQKVCTDFCNGDEDCPDDWVCAAVANSGADRTFLCFPEAEFLCNGCNADEECGGRSDWCLSYPDGDFCGRSCDVRACPDGFDCVQIPREGQEPSWQCQLADGYCSGCFDPDNDGHGVGDECLGIDCDEENPNRHESAVEICDGVDDNCDDVADESFDLTTDPDHCGACDNRCDYDGAEALCVDSQCELGPCLENRYDIDERADNGCEYFCEVANEGVEVCNGEDENCDGAVDETFDLLGDVTNCGECGRACAFPHAVPTCDAGDCAIRECEELWYNVDGIEENGCEYACILSNNGVEACDNLDNDCDGLADEDYDFQNDPSHCGACGEVCDLDNAIENCSEGRCGIADCEDGYDNCNDEAPDGCEIDIHADVENCGACGEVCAPFEAEGICRRGDCQIFLCQPGFQNCDNRHDTGCESERAVDPDNCGGCDNVCDFDNAGRACEDGRCVMGRCDEGWVDLDRDDSNGCEYRCTFIREDDQPDPGGIDEDCDGVDGNREDAVFVRSNGNDLNDGLTVGSAVLTLGRALEITSGRDRDQILIATGSYTTDAALDLQSGVSLYGGYSADFRTRDNGRATLTAMSNTALRATNLAAPVVIAQLNVSVTNRSTRGAAAIAVTVNNSGNRLTIRDSNITAGRGGLGVDGNQGPHGGDGSDGAPGSGSSGGGPGSLGGGRGANGRRQGSGPAGAAGASNGSPCGGSAGAGSGNSGLGCGDGDPRAGGNGGAGCNGTTGTPGTPGNGVGSLAGVTWSRSNGTAGGAGSHGGGGGGGGAGGGEDCTAPIVGCIFCGTGRGGGGGGGGGRAGGGGTGGGGGGASIGLLIRASTVTLDNVEVTTVGGGNGGRGGNRGVGGPGGAGGAGATDGNNRNGNGGGGGRGGNGGSGGCGGGGGGGPSVAVWGNGSAAVRRLGDTSFTAGIQGAGGPSCDRGGQQGIRNNTRSVTITQ